MRNKILTDYSFPGGNSLVARPHPESRSGLLIRQGIVIGKYIVFILLLTTLMSIFFGATPDVAAATVYVAEDETIEEIKTVSSDTIVRILPGVTLTVANTGKLDVLGTIQNLGTVRNNGAIVIKDSGTLDNGAVIINTSVISNNSRSVGINNLAGAIITNAAGKIQNYGTMINRSGGAINNENIGSIENHDGGVIRNHGGINNYFSDIENHAGGTIHNDGVINSEFGADINNKGQIETSNSGTIINQNGLTFLWQDETVKGMGKTLDKPDSDAAAVNDITKNEHPTNNPNPQVVKLP